MSLMTHPDFIMAVKIAKAIALASSQHELTPNLVIAGFFTMLARKMEVSEKFLWSREQSLRDACVTCHFPLNST